MMHTSKVVVVVVADAFVVVWCTVSLLEAQQLV
jgi:hypothetical protein